MQEKILEKLIRISDSNLFGQAVLEAINSLRVTSRLECIDILSIISSRNRIRLIWVPECRRIKGNEKVDELARQRAFSLRYARTDTWHT